MTESEMQRWIGGSNRPLTGEYGTKTVKIPPLCRETRPIGRG